MADDLEREQPHEGMTPYRERSTSLRPDPSNFEPPEGMVTLTEITDGTLGFDLTEITTALGWDPEENWVSVAPDSEGGPALIVGRVPKDESDTDPSMESNLQTIEHSLVDGEPRVQIPVPDRHLELFGINGDSYRRGSDPFLFDTFAEAEYPDTIILEPLGYVSDWVWPNSDFNFPEVGTVVQDVADVSGVDEDELTGWIDRVAGEVVTPTFLQFGVPIEERPTFLTVNGQRVAIVTTSAVDGLPGLVQILGNFYRLQSPLLDAVWEVHQRTAQELLSELHGGSIPDDHPIQQENIDATVIPVTPGREDGEAGIMSKTTTPIKERTVTAVAAGSSLPVDVYNWLTDFATEVTNDMVKDSGLRVDREPVNIPYTPSTPLPVDYSGVRIHFVEEGALETLAAEAGLSEPDPAAQRAHDEQAERLLMALPEVPQDYKLFREDSHAIVVPIFDDEEGNPATNGASSSNQTPETDGSGTTQQTLPGNN